MNVAYHIAACDPLVQFTKLEAIRDIEREVQQRWEREKTFEIDAPKVVCHPITRHNFACMFAAVRLE